MASLSELTGVGGGTAFAPKLATPFFSSGTFVAPQDGIVEIRAMGAGGSGAWRETGATTATGGYSGAWGAKLLRVSKGQSIIIAVGAGGISRTTAGSGNQGGNTSITVDGVAYVASGGAGGVYAASGTPTIPNAAVISSLWDIGAASVKPGVFAGASTGGAGVDILAQGNNATTSASVANSGGGGTGFPGVGSDGGGAMPGGLSGSGASPSTNIPIYEDLSNREWIISFYGGSGAKYVGNTAFAPGGNGGGGGTTSTSHAGGSGGNGGGGGINSTSYIGGSGGIGGGGGAGSPSGNGGNGFAVVNFFTESGV